MNLNDRLPGVRAVDGVERALELGADRAHPSFAAFSAAFLRSRSNFRASKPPIGYFFLPPEDLPPPDPRGLPASLRLARHVPSSFRLRGCFPPPSSET